MTRFLLLLLVAFAALPARAQTPLPVSNAELIRDHLYLSPSGSHFLLFRPDGDLVVVDTDGQIVWGLGGMGVAVQGADRAAMQPDGTLAVYAADGARLWSALADAPGPGAALTISADGDLQIVTEAGPVWSARTGALRPVEGCAPVEDAAGGMLPPGATPAYVAYIACIERLAHDEANRAREAAGLGPLAWSDAFAAVARAHSEDMVRRGYVAHDTPEGLTFSDRMEAASLDCSGRRAENIAGAHAVGLEYVNDADEVVSVEWLPQREVGAAPVVSWMNSPPHRRNLLNPDHHRHAIGVAWDAEAQMYRATQLLCE
ncbi:CAP domain-containing protein [Rubrivirga sp. SAORIC476]|uniref:CAP domain-containing protein n=1 Tax=Rubrivirga sp. SAORIC476 TaxID=1961794 RepID=UPI001179BF7B|nr:CAP domain-containing protein [Rubrivirga sp. SAORIC476]